MEIAVPNLATLQAPSDIWSQNAGAESPRYTF